MRARGLSVLIVLVSTVAASFAASEDARSRALVLCGGLDGHELERIIGAPGGEVLVHVPELSAAIVRVPDSARGAIARHPSLQAFFDDAIGALDPRLAPSGSAHDPLVRAWLEARAIPSDDIRGESLGIDALVAAPWWEETDVLPPKDGAQGRPYGADWQNTSEYLAGAVTLNLLLPESNGGVDRDSEDWTEALEMQIVAEAMDAAADLIALYPGSSLSFTIHVYSGRTDARLETRYEPIARDADPSGTTGEDRWVKEVLGNLGFADGSRLTRSRIFADETRIADGTDWAVNVFVINAANDADGKFADGYFAYAWLGGPHTILTTDNSNWGISRFNWVLRHELHHSFFALDQYAASNCSCDATSGYLAGSNGNCELGCGPVEPDVMRDNALAATDWTRRQVGTLDSDLDGTPDLLSVPPEVSLTLESGDLSCDGIVVLSGLAQVVAAANLNPTYVTPRENISIARIADVEVRVNGGPWQRGLALARDGSYDAHAEAFDVAISLSTGRHQVESRAVDSRGNVSLEASRSVDVAESAEPLGPSLQLVLGPSGVTLSWAAASGAATYRVRRASDPQSLGDSDPAAELAATTWLDTSPGTVFYRVSAVDGCQREIP